VKESARSDRAALQHILDAGRNILEFAADGEKTFLEDRRTRAAIEREFEIIGEATKRLSLQARTAEPDLPWSQVARFRDFLIHGYDRVTPDVVWNVIKEHLPTFLAGVERLLRRS
jgi:uncharacterized protein with HEPN domain